MWCEKHYDTPSWEQWLEIPGNAEFKQELEALSVEETCRRYHLEPSWRARMNAMFEAHASTIRCCLKCYAEVTQLVNETVPA